MKNSILKLITSVGLGLSIGWVLAAQEPKPADTAKKDWKGQEEYNLFQAFQKADPKGKIEALDKWKAAFPASDFAQEREEQYLFVYQQTNMNREAFDKAAEILKTRPNHFYSLSAIERLIYTLPPPPKPADLDTAERVSKYLLDNLDTVFAASNKPMDVKDADWTTYKPAMKNAAQATLAWVYVQRKDHPKAETELTKYLHLDPTQAASSLSLGGEILAQNQEHPEKIPLGLYQFARAASYEGQNSLPAAARQQARDYLTKTYTTYHGSNEGLDKLLASAKNNPFPPEGFTIESAQQIATKKAADQENFIKTHPELGLWQTAIKDPLTKDGGEAYFEMNVKGALLPGGANGVQKFRAKIVSMTPATKPKEIVLALEQPNVPDVTLELSQALPGKMEPGEELQFEGVAKSYTKQPFMVVFDVEPNQIEGWTGKNATPARSSAGKGKAKAKAKQ
ncbi:MAG TPA: hypothetical protein VGQ49_20085 [Bryobacteraceae bacterium]|jgi:hypothetical protein|nr:hypothetical protein [Bryobacteraceae bacterium]